MAARKRTWTPDIVRERIRVSMLRHRLENHVLGKCELSPTQVRAAEVLLKKCLPDLTAVALSGSVSRAATDIPDAELASIATGSSDGVVESTPSSSELTSVH